MSKNMLVSRDILFNFKIYLLLITLTHTCVCKQFSIMVPLNFRHSLIRNWTIENNRTSIINNLNLWINVYGQIIIDCQSYFQFLFAKLIWCFAYPTSGISIIHTTDEENGLGRDYTLWRWEWVESSGIWHTKLFEKVQYKTRS